MTNTPSHAISRVLEDVSAQLYRLHHQLTLYSDCAGSAPPRTQASSVLAESLSVTFQAFAQDVGAQMSRLDQLYSEVFQLENQA